MKGKIILVLLAVIVCIGFVTNPSEQDHRNCVGEKLEKSLQNTIDEKTSGKAGGLLSALGKMASSKLVAPAVNELVSRDNYGVFSLTKLEWDGEKNTIGVGLLGHVFVSDKVETAFQDYLKKYNK